MPQSRRKSLLNFISKSDIIKIATIVTLVFVLTNFVKITALMDGSKDISLFTWIHNKLSVPSQWKIWIKQPWSLITFMFSAEQFINVFFDFIWLWIFGSVIEDLKGQYRVLPIYLMGGIIGGLGYIVAGSFWSAETYYYLGVTPSIMAVAVATILYNPQYPYWFFTVRIPIWIVGVIFLILKLSTLNQLNGPVIVLIALGGLVGVWYNYLGTSVFDILTDWLKRFGNFFGNNENFMERKQRKMPFTHLNVTASKVDRILDKINQKGINSLTPEERRLLEQYSKE